MIKARWNIEKGRSLLENSDRGGVSFEDCIVAFEEGRILDDLVHLNQTGFIGDVLVPILRRE